MKYWVLDKIFNHASKPRQMEYLVVDESFRILDISEQVQQFAEHATQVQLGKDIRDSFPELIGFEDILTAVLQGKQDIFELKGIARVSECSQPLYIDIYAIGDRDENTFQQNLIILLEDVTEKMVSEQDLAQTIRETTLQSIALDARKNYLDQILNSMPEALIVTTCSGKIKTVNLAALELFGYREVELIGQPILTFVADDKIAHKTCNSKYLKDFKIVCKTKTGQKIEVTFSRSTIQTEFEECQDFVYVVRELTSACGERER